MKRLLVVFTMLSLLVPVLLTACGGGDGEDTSTPEVTETTVNISTPTPAGTSISASSVPVKLGVICSWSGPSGVAGQLADQIIGVVDQQLKDMGGILGGREVEFIKGDDGGTVAGAAAQATKLVLQDKVDMLLFGGIGGAHQNAVAKEAENLKVPYVSVSTVFESENMKYSIALYTKVPQVGRIAGFTIDYLKARTIAWLGFDDEALRSTMDGWSDLMGVRDQWKNAGIDIVYEQWYPTATIDYSPYLTKIKYLKPDVLVIAVNSVPEALTINKQIMDLGGWGDIKVFNCLSGSSSQKVVAMPAAVGNYVAADFMQGSDDPGMKAFEEAFQKKWGKSPTPELSYYYNDFWSGIKAIEMAGTTDHDKVAQAMRSGNLKWDSAWGPLIFNPDGNGVAAAGVAQVQEGGSLVKVWTWTPE